MNDFELRRQLQNLATPREPERDLWAGVAARIASEAQAGPATAPVQRRDRSIWPFALAASLLLSVGVAAMLLKPQASMPQETLAEMAPASLHTAKLLRRSYDGALAAAGGDAVIKASAARSELTAARTEIDAATLELTQALEQNPDSLYLLDLMRKTQERRLKLARLAVEIG